jgi:hypothetical protein
MTLEEALTRVVGVRIVGVRNARWSEYEAGSGESFTGGELRGDLELENGQLLELALDCLIMREPIPPDAD